MRTFVLGKPKNSHDAAYEAKFKRYLYNKHLKTKFDESHKSDTKREYDTWMYGPESPHKDAKTIDWEGTDTYKKMHFSGKKDFSEDLHEDQLLREGLTQQTDKLEVMSKQDEIIFNILKWIFNAIKKDMELVDKLQVIEQLKSNSDTILSLGFTNIQEFKTELLEFPTTSEGKMSWEEFIDFFISKSGLGDQKSEWWKTFLQNMDEKEVTQKKLDFYNSPDQKARRLTEKAYAQSSDRKKINFDINETEEANLKRLTGTRVDEIKNSDIYNENTKDGYDTAADELDIFKNKPK